MRVQLKNVATTEGRPISLRCPHCNQIGTFEPIKGVADAVVPNQVIGIRKCPSQTCCGQLFFIGDSNFAVQRAYPALRIDFDSSNIPEQVLKSISEAITCHAEGCHSAAAIMIRRCLEELCDDRHAEGSDLKSRIDSLRTKITLPNELFEAMNELRLLGNDAAHVEAKVYDNIDANAVAIGLELTKEILKATYQLEGLIKRLKALKGAQ